MRAYVTFLLYLLCSPAIGQVDSTAYLQGRLDSENVIDLDGKTYYVKWLIVGPQHNGKELKNGVILALPDKTHARNAIIEVVKNRSWRGVNHPNSPVNFTFRNLEVAGQFRNESNDIAVNVERGKADGWWTNGINCVNLGCWIDSVSLIDCKIHGVGAAGFISRAKTTVIERCRFEHIGQHAIGGLCDTGPDEEVVATVRDVIARDCGTAFDFASQIRDFNYVNRKHVTIENFTARNIYGRTKFHGPWSGTLNNLDFEQERFIPSQYGALNFPEGSEINVSNLRIKNFWYAGIMTLNVPTANIKPKITVTNATIENSLSGLYIQCEFHANNIQMFNCWNTFTSLSPTTAVNVTNTARDTVYWAKQANRAEFEFMAWNAMYGTAYPEWSRRWIPDAVKTEAMKQRN